MKTKYHLIDDGFNSYLVEEDIVHKTHDESFMIVAKTKRKKWHKLRKPEKIHFYRMRNMDQHLEIDKSDAIAILMRAT